MNEDKEVVLVSSGAVGVGLANMGLVQRPKQIPEQQALAAECKQTIEKYQEQVLPAIIQIPGVSGNTGMGVQGVKDSVERAVGSDILFSNN